MISSTEDQKSFSEISETEPATKAEIGTSLNMKMLKSASHPFWLGPPARFPEVSILVARSGVVRKQKIKNFERFNLKLLGKLPGIWAL